MNFKVYIPARYASTRLPGKLLLPVGSKPLIQLVYENARDSGAEEVIIATDDERIENAARAFGACVELTDSAHTSGTDRIAQAVAKRAEASDEIIVNVQGDEPLLPPIVMRQVATLLAERPQAQMATVCEPMNEHAIDDRNTVKVVRGDDDRALYFSRAPIPCSRDGRAFPYRRHVGIYAYRAAYLQQFVARAPAELEQVERLEQLRALAHNDIIIAADAAANCGIGVDTRADFENLCAQLEVVCDE